MNDRVRDSGASPDAALQPRKRLSIALILFIGVPLLSVVAYATAQRGPVRALDCWLADDFFVDVPQTEVTLSELRAAVKEDTRNCIHVRVFSGPTGDESIVVLPSPAKWVFYRGEHVLDVRTVS